MDFEEYRIIPGYEGYSVNCTGVIKSIGRNLVLKQYMLNGYLIVDTFRNSLTETLPVHRAVALAWVVNPKPEQFNIVNHDDGNTLNNYWTNLEWTNHSGNNYHAVNTGLRQDNICCKVRDFTTGVVTSFNSVAQAAEFMGFRKDKTSDSLCRKKFGALLAGRFEFKFANDLEPWFYENRTELVPASRYMVIVTEEDGSQKEIYSTKVFLKEYQLYGATLRSIPDLAKYANEIYPNKRFSVRDSYSESRVMVRRNTKKSKRMVIIANSDKQSITFDSLTQCAKLFKVDRSSIFNRLNNGKQLDGWTFTQMPS